MGTQDQVWEYFTGEEAIVQGMLRHSTDQYQIDKHHWAQIDDSSFWATGRKYRRRKQPETVPPKMEKFEQWVSVKERLPELNKSIWLWFKEHLAYYQKGLSFDLVEFQRINQSWTHWMYAEPPYAIPAPPTPPLAPWQIAMNELLKGANQITINENSDLFRVAFEAGVKYAKGDK